MITREAARILENNLTFTKLVNRPYHSAVDESYRRWVDLYTQWLASTFPDIADDYIAGVADFQGQLQEFRRKAEAEARRVQEARRRAKELEAVEEQRRQEALRAQQSQQAAERAQRKAERARLNAEAEAAERERLQRAESEKRARELEERRVSHERFYREEQIQEARGIGLYRCRADLDSLEREIRYQQKWGNETGSAIQRSLAEHDYPGSNPYSPDEVYFLNTSGLNLTAPGELTELTVPVWPKFAHSHR